MLKLSPRQQTHRNLILFREQLIQAEHKGDERFYEALFDPETGAFQFQKKISDLTIVPLKVQKSWHPVQLVVRETAEGISFDAKISLQEGSGEGFAILDEMISLLNAKGRLFTRGREGLPERSLLQELLTHLSTPLEVKEIEREEAEEILAKSEVGGYLFRFPDPVALLSVEALAREMGHPMGATVINWRGAEGKIEEKIILQMPSGWILYQGNPDLSQERCFATLEELLFAHRCLKRV